MEDIEIQRVYELKTGKSAVTSEYFEWKKRFQEEVCQIWEERYSFLSHWNLHLIARYDLQARRQKLILKAFDPNNGKLLSESVIHCIHTAIVDIPAESIEGRKSDPEFLDEILQLRSSEKARPLELAPKDEFFALKSWVQGIAEAGFNAIAIQRNIESYAHLMYPISQFLFKAMLEINIYIVIDFIHWIKKKCIFEEGPHIPSIAANLLHITEMLFINITPRSFKWEEYSPIITELMELISYSLQNRLENQKFFMKPIARILKFILKQEQYQFANQFMQWICEIFEVKNLTEVEPLMEFIAPLLDTFSAHYWVLQKLYQYLKEFEENPSDGTINVINVPSLVNELGDLGISPEEIYALLLKYKKEGLLIKLSDIIKSEKGKIVISPSYLADLKNRIRITKSLAVSSVNCIPSPSFFLRHRKFSFLLEDIVKDDEEIKFYLSHCVTIRGGRYFCILNFNDNPDDIALDLSHLHLTSLTEVDWFEDIADKITHIDLSKNPIDHLEELSKCTKLKVLNLKDTYIRDLEQIRCIIENLHCLHTIICDYHILKPIITFLFDSDEQNVTALLSKFQNYGEIEHQENTDKESIYKEPREQCERLLRAFSSNSVNIQDCVEIPAEFTIVTLIRKYYRYRDNYREFWTKTGVMSQ
ncbi:MAG: hypothetical protein JW776_05525 [Candidatus Lokiarchaeota archaeon]|nr:hypothetical protein [Candidatus Lokiarchaeota archaeon]